MKIKEVPIYNEDGSVTATLYIKEKEAQVLLEFALNFLSSVGLVGVTDQNVDLTKMTPHLND